LGGIALAVLAQVAGGSAALLTAGALVTIAGALVARSRADRFRPAVIGAREL
jgi:hypothetical protein